MDTMEFNSAIMLQMENTVQEILNFSFIFTSSSRASSAVTALTSTVMGTGALSEKTMLAVKRLKLSKEDNAPSLDDFDREMGVYRVSIDSLRFSDGYLTTEIINLAVAQ